jgi:tetratricopeptide (TPR) repeat protein
MRVKVNAVASAVRIASGLVRVFSPVEVTTAALAASLDKLSGLLDTADGALGIAADIRTPIDAAIARTATELARAVPARFRDLSEMAVGRVQDAVDQLGPERAMTLAMLGERDFLAGLIDSRGPRLYEGLSDEEHHAVDMLLRTCHAAILSLAKSPALLGDSTVAGLQHLASRDADAAARLSAVEADVAALRASTRQRHELARLVSGSRPARAVNFVERSIGARLWQRLQDTTTVTVRSLTGMRGVGKSQIASALATRCIEEGWSGVVWIDAASRDDIVRQLADVAIAAGVAQPDDEQERASRLLLTWFASQPATDRLVVFDNVVDLDHLLGMLPTGDGLRVVVTTTVVSDTIGEPVDVGLYTRDEAIGYLQGRTGLTDRDGADRVAAALGDLPLGVTQAATAIRLLDLDYDEYLAQLDEHPLRGTFQRAPGDSYPEAVDVALISSIEAVISAFADEATVETARTMIYAMALMSEAGVPRTWLVDAAPDAWAGREILGSLIAHSVAMTSSDGQVIAIHRLLARVLRVSPSMSDVDEPALTFALQVIRQALAMEDADFLRRRVHLSELSSQMRSIVGNVGSASRSVTEQAITLLGQLAEATTEAHVPSAGVSLVPAFERLSATPDIDPTYLAAAGTTLASAFRQSGDPERAVDLLTMILADFERTHGPEHFQTLATRNNLAHVLLRGDTTERAVDMLEELLPDCERLLGADSSLALACRANIAHGLLRLGRDNDAVRAYEALLDDILAVVEADDDDVLEIRYGLARALEQAGDPRAVSAFITVLESFEQAKGGDHHRTIDARRGLARAHTAAGDRDLAVVHAKRAVADEERVVGIDHHSTIDARGELAAAYDAVGDGERAIELLTQTLEDHERIVGADHHDTYKYRNSLAVAQVSAGRQDDALLLFERNLTELESAGSRNFDDLIVITRTNLAHTCESLGQLLRAGSLYQENARQYERSEGVGSESAIVHWTAASRVARRLGSPRRAIHLIEHALRSLDHAEDSARWEHARLSRRLESLRDPQRGCLHRYTALPPLEPRRRPHEPAASGVSTAPPKRRSRDR